MNKKMTPLREFLCKHFNSVNNASRLLKLHQNQLNRQCQMGAYIDDEMQIYIPSKGGNLKSAYERVRESNHV